MKSSIKKLFLEKSPPVYQTYLKIVETIEKNIGQVEVNPKKTCIHLTSKSDFGGVHPKKNWLDFNMVLDHPARDERIIKVELGMRNGKVYRIGTDDSQKPGGYFLIFMNSNIINAFTLSIYLPEAI